MDVGLGEGGWVALPFVLAGIQLRTHLFVHGRDIMGIGGIRGIILVRAIEFIRSIRLIRLVRLITPIRICTVSLVSRERRTESSSAAWKALCAYFFFKC